MKSQDSKLVPKNLMNRFSVGKSSTKNKEQRKRLKNRKSERTEQRLTKVQVIFFSELPPLPEPSPGLQDVLERYNEKRGSDCSGQFLFSCSNHKRKSRSKTGHRLNGFMAFRSFYSRSVFDVEHQRQLSSILGSLWKNEPRQDVWNRYAIEYNSRATKEDFIEWLTRTLGLEVLSLSNPSTNIVKNNKWQFSSNTQDCSVEDIYYVKST